MLNGVSTFGGLYLVIAMMKVLKTGKNEAFQNFLHCCLLSDVKYCLEETKKKRILKYSHTF